LTKKFSLVGRKMPIVHFHTIINLLSLPDHVRAGFRAFIVPGKMFVMP
jgi:hypothetical protein